MISQPDPQWVRSGWGYRVASQDELLRAVSRIGSLHVGRRYVWRGIADARYRIRSSLYRSLLAEVDAATERDLRQRERSLLREARRWGLGLGPTGFVSDLHLLAQLQHHGTPTRLLDVTTNPMTALWFSCQRAAKDRDAAGAVFAFDVTDVPEYDSLSFGPSTWGEMGDPAGWSLRLALAVSERDRKPFLVRPTLRDDRMRAQEGLFLASTTPAAPVEPPGLDGMFVAAGEAPGRDRFAGLFAPVERGRGAAPQLPFCALVVPPSTKRKLAAHLRGTYDRDFRTMFPDLAGFADAHRQGVLDVSDPIEPEEPVFGDADGDSSG